MVKTKKKREKLSAFCRRLQWPEFLRALPILVKWLLIAGMVGLIVGFVASGFGYAGSSQLPGFRLSQPV